MKDYLNHLTERNFQNRTVAFIENGSWSPMANKVMKSYFEKSKNIQYAEHSVTIKSALNDETKRSIETLAKELSL